MKMTELAPGVIKGEARRGEAYASVMHTFHVSTCDVCEMYESVIFKVFFKLFKKIYIVKNKNNI